jgi:hypothetical protein
MLPQNIDELYWTAWHDCRIQIFNVRNVKLLKTRMSG